MAKLPGLSMSLLGRKSKDGKNTMIYLLVRTTGLGEKRMSTGFSVPASSYKDGRLVGRSSSIVNLERSIAAIKKNVEAAYHELIQKNQVPTPDLIMAQVEGRAGNQKTLSQIMDILIEQKEISVKSGEASGSLSEKFRILKTQVLEFVRVIYRKKDLFLYELNLDFVARLAVYLREIPNANITVNKKIDNLAQCFIYATKNGWIQKNPCSDWKRLPEAKTNHEHLKREEFEKLLDFKLPNPTHEVVKDSFIFMCLTGMSFSDMNRFRLDQIKEVNGELVISYTRKKLEKLEREIRIPVLDRVLELVNKNYLKPKRVDKRRMVAKNPSDPVFSIQGGKIYNEKIKYLFEYNEMDLGFSISSHAARKTFGNLITQGMGISDASELLGHSNIKTTKDNYVDNMADPLLIQRLAKMREIFRSI